MLITDISEKLKILNLIFNRSNGGWKYYGLKVMVYVNVIMILQLYVQPLNTNEIKCLQIKMEMTLYTRKKFHE